MPTVKFLGTAGDHPSETRQTVCALIPEFGIVLDLGTGALKLRDQTSLPTLDIFLSHPRLDHFIGASHLLTILEGAGTSARFWGAPAHLKALISLEFLGKFCPYKTEGAPTTKWVGLAKEGLSETFNFTAKELPSPDGSMGYKFNFPGGKKLVYITDTACSYDYVDFARGADVLIHECRFPDTIPGTFPWSGRELAEKTFHAWTSGVAKVALATGAKQLVLTHLNPLDGSPDPTHQNEATVRHPNTVIAEDGMMLEF